MLGTMGYMSPEQVRGKAADKRVGPLLVRDDPLRDARRAAGVPGRHGGRHDHGDPDEGAAGPRRRRTRTCRPALERIVRHCLEKNPEERFESARDVAFDLESLSSVSSPTARRGDAARFPPADAGSAPAAIAAVLALAAGLAAGYRLRQEGRLRPAAHVPAAHVPPRRALLRALRAGRPDRHLLRGLGRQARRDLRDAHGPPGVACLRPGGRRSAGDFEDRRDARVTRAARRRSRSSGAARWPRWASRAASLPGSF